MLSKKLTTESGARSVFISTLQLIQTQRRKDAKNVCQYLLCMLCALCGLFAFPLRLCAFASLRLKKLQNGFQKASLLLCALCGIFSTPYPLQADPWGKDADLAKCRPARPSCTESQSGPGVAFSELFIRFHQEVISPADGPRSHFIPSSSQYTMDAVHRYGFFKGWMMGCDRLMRENDDPWVYKKCLSPAGQVIKYDPIK